MIDAFITAARSYIGTPFKHQGRLPGVGLDCAGVVVCAMREAGIPVEDVARYSRLPRNGQFLAAVLAHADEVQFDDRRDGDVMMFSFRSEPQHIAVFDRGTIIHSHQAVGRVLVQTLCGDWLTRLRGCYRLRGC